MADARHLTTEELEAGVEKVRLSPKDGGVVAMLVRRSRVDAREVLDEATLDPSEGVVGDNWVSRGVPQVDRQITLMNARAAQLVAGERARWPLAGDQIYLDLDLGPANLPAGTRLSLGTAVVEVTELPHTGCRKFAARFGADAAAFVNSPTGKELSLRGINARVIRGGTVRVGDTATKVASE